MDLRPTLLLVLGLVTLTFTSAGGGSDHNVTLEAYKPVACRDHNCSTVFSKTTKPEVTKNGSCSEHPDGWGLRGSDWGCCGNYDGCCTYASLLCYFHDAMCRCCDVGDNFCGPTCKPEVSCYGGKPEDVIGYERHVTQPGKKLNIDMLPARGNDDGKEIEEETLAYPETNSTLNETAMAVGSNLEVHHDNLNIEQLEIAINTTENYDNFNLELDKLFNETEELLSEYDGVYYSEFEDDESITSNDLGKDSVNYVDNITKLPEHFRTSKDGIGDITESLNSRKDNIGGGVNETKHFKDTTQARILFNATTNESKLLNDTLVQIYSTDAANETKLFKDTTTPIYLNVTPSETEHAMNSVHESPDMEHDYLDIEAIEKVINTTDTYSSEFELEMDSLFNETAFIFDGFDELWEDYGSGDLEV